jgi:hypothetical protein
VIGIYWADGRVVPGARHARYCHRYSFGWQPEQCPGAPNSFALGRQSALAEAHALYRMIQPECSVEELRELIAVPPHIERVLRAYAKAHAEDAHWIESCLKFRQAVAEEFERLLCAGAAVTDFPEVDDALDPVEQGSAAA